MEKRELILKEFTKHKFEGRIPSDLNNIHNPVYTVISKSLKMSISDIFEVVLEMQPRVLTKEHRYVFHIFSSFTSHVIWWIKFNLILVYSGMTHPCHRIFWKNLSVILLRIFNQKNRNHASNIMPHTIQRSNEGIYCIRKSIVSNITYIFL